MIRILVVTTMNKEGYDAYGKYMVENMRENLNDMDFHVYTEGFVIPGVNCLDLYKSSPDLKNFIEKHENNPSLRGIMKDGSYNFLYDAVKFAHKVFCIIHAMEKCHDIYSHVIWLDADTLCLKRVSPEVLVPVLPEEKQIASYLGREHLGMYTETGFMCFNVRYDMTRIFADMWKSVYNDDLFVENPKSFKSGNFDGFTDCHTFDHVRRMFPQSDFKNLGKNIVSTMMFEAHPILRKYFTHYKGNRKKYIASGKPANIVPKR